MSNKAELLEILKANKDALSREEITAVVDSTLVSQLYDKRSVSYEAFGSSEPVTISMPEIRQVIANKTAKGIPPSDRDCWLFMKLCLARRLNPLAGDAFLIGYDTRDGAVFHSVIAHTALLKRAELSEHYDGMESGVIVMQDGSPVEMDSAFCLDTKKIVGGWARVYRKDRDRVTSKKVLFDVYNTNRSRWMKDPAGMIVKVAEAAAIRSAFPSDLAGMYAQEEMDNVEAKEGGRIIEAGIKKIDKKSVTELMAKMDSPEPEPEPEAVEAEVIEPVNDVAEKWDGEWPTWSDDIEYALDKNDEMAGISAVQARFLEEYRESEPFIRWIVASRIQELAIQAAG